MPPILPITLPEYFYLPRYSRCGFEIRDVMPWEEALSYVTDGARFGVQLRDGAVRWLLVPVRDGMLATQYRLVAESIPPALRIVASPREIVREIWRDNEGMLAAMTPSDRAASPA